MYCIFDYALYKCRCVHEQVIKLLHVLYMYSTCTSKFSICFEAWAKSAQQWLVCAPLRIHPLAASLAQIEICTVPNKTLRANGTLIKLNYQYKYI